MGVIVGLEINVNSASAMHCCGNSFSSYAVPISSRPFFGSALNSRIPRKFRVFHVRKLNFGAVSAASLNVGGGSNAGLVSDALLTKDLEFKPSFEEYLKAMESARTSRGKEHDASAGDASSQKHKMRENGVSRKSRIERGGREDKRFQRVGEKGDAKDEWFEGSEEGSFRSKARGVPTKGLKNEHDWKGREDKRFQRVGEKGDAKDEGFEGFEEGSFRSKAIGVPTKGFKNEHDRNGREDTRFQRVREKGDAKDEGFEDFEEGSFRSKARRAPTKGLKNEHDRKGREDKRFQRVGEKGDAKDEGFEGSEEGFVRSKARRAPTKGLKNEHDRTGSNLVENAREDRRLKHKSHSLGHELDECSVSKSQGESSSGRISNNITKSISNSHRSVMERGVTNELYSSKISGDKVGNSWGRDNKTQGKTHGRENIVATPKVMDRAIERWDNRQRNVKLSGSNKHYLDRGYDSDELEVERAAFKNLEDSNSVISKQHFSHKEVEERIQTLAKLLNGADIDLAEWMFSKMMRSAKIKFNDYSITRVIIILGKLGNWRRVIQVIEWLQRRERFKPNKLRHIYTAALDALGKSRRPVEALNVFHTMQQQMSSYPDLVAYHSIAVTLGQAGHMKELFDVIDIMRSPPKKKFRTGPLEKLDPRLEPDIVVYNAVLNACVKKEQWEGAFWVLQQLKNQGIQPSATTYGLVMEVMLSCGKYNLVHEFFRKLQKSCIPNSLTYRVLLNALWKEGKTDEAILAVQEMERRGIVGSASLYYDLARCLCAAGRSREALKQINKICKVANKPLVVTYTGLMQASLDSGHIQDGAYILEKMKEVCAPNLVTCNIMLKAYLEHGMFQEAKGQFEQMLENTNHLKSETEYNMLVIPDIYTFNIMLDACVAEKRWDYFHYVYQRMLCHGFHFNPKRHLRMVLEASRAGKVEPLEITWKHLADADRTPPVTMIKEMFCLKLEKGDNVGALKCITTYPLKDLEPFSKSSWLKLFKENSQRFQEDTLVRLLKEAANIVSNSSNTHNPTLVCLLQSCKDFFSADMDSVKTVFIGEINL